MKHFGKAVMNSGDDYRLTESITLHHPTISDMLSINNGVDSENIYWKYIQVLMCDPYSNMVMLDDMGRDFMTTTPFEVFILQWKKYEDEYEQNKPLYDSHNFKPIDIVLKALNFFITEEHDYVYGVYENGEECIYDRNNSKCQINKEIFEYIYEWLMTIHKIDYANRINPEDENARRILIEDTRDQIKKANRRKNKDQNDDIEYIGTLTSAVCYGGNGVITPFNVKSCKMYWLFEAYEIDARKSQANHILDGLYHGTISHKDINNRELDWAHSSNHF